MTDEPPIDGRDEPDPYEGYEDVRWTPPPEDEAWLAQHEAEQAAKAGQAGRHLRSVPDPDPVEEEAAGNAIEYLLPALDWRALFAEDDDGEEWILEPILSARRMVALYSAPKVGKSLLALEVAANVSRGHPALGVKPDRAYRVLYVDFENDPRGDVRRRLEDMGYDYELVADGALDNLAYLSFPSLSKLDTPQGGAELLAAAQHYACEVVVIDTVSRTIGGEENDNNTWLNFYKCTGVPLKREGIACLRLDHSGKDADRGMRGGSAKYGDVDAVWKLSAESETVLTLECTDKRMRVENDRLTIVREEYDYLHHRVAEGGMRLALDARENEIMRDIEALGLPASSANNEIYKALVAQGKGRSKKVVFKVAKEWKRRLEETHPDDTASCSGTTGNNPAAPDPPLVPRSPPRRGDLEQGTGGWSGTGPGPCTDPSHSPRRIGGFWICPDCNSKPEE